jgi:nucleotide-binding universal stress UspA family protein
MKILLATDGSDSAREAVDLLIRFPFPKDSSATALTVIDDRIFTVSRPGDLDEDQNRLLQETERTIKEESEQLLAAESARLRDAGWSGSTEIRKGDPAEEIIQAAEELQPDLIVLGSHGFEGMKNFLLGSISDQVLRYAGCSVLIARSSPKMSTPADSGDLPWRILMAYDDSEPAKKAISLCASLPLDENAEVQVIGVMPMIHMFRQDIRQQLNTVWQQQKHAMKEALKEAVGALQWSTPHVSSTLKQGSDVSQEILDIAQEEAMDLVVLGDKGQSAIKRFLLGSITSRIAHHAPCSVLVVRS